MVRIHSMVAASMLASVLSFTACGGNKSSGKGSDGGAGDGGGSNAGGAGGSGVGGSAGDAGGVGAGGSAGGTGAGGTGTTGGAGGTGPVPITCEATANPQCNDGMDNDGDGKIDSIDFECVGPCDNDEGSFSTGIPGDNIDACKQDCFFDGNSGQGDDGCNWNLKCDPAGPGGTSCPYVAGTMNCKMEQDAKCIRNCRKLAPNGCDCFGCCAVSAGGQEAQIMLVATCTADKFGDPVACPRCTQNTSCLNTCEKCEVCLGRPAPDPSCNTGQPGTDGGTPGTDASTPGTDAGTGTQCAGGLATCGAGVACAAGFYCQTGCCVRFTIE
jgi:hypothetical protein